MQRKQQGIKAAIFLFVMLVGIAVCIIGIVEIDRFADSDRTNVYVVNSSYSTALAWFYHGSIYEGVALFFIGFGGIVIGIIGAAGAAMTLSGGDSEKQNAPAAPYGGAPVQGRPTTPGYPQQPYYGGPMPSQPGMQAHPMPTERSHASLWCATAAEQTHAAVRRTAPARQTHASLRRATAAEQADASLRRATSTGTSDASLRCAGAARHTVHSPSKAGPLHLTARSSARRLLPLLP